MKYIVIYGMGLAEQSKLASEEKTSLDNAKIPIMNGLAGKGIVGQLYCPSQHISDVQRPIYSKTLAAEKKTIEILADQNKGECMGKDIAEAFRDKSYELAYVSLEALEDTQKVEVIEQLDAMLGRLLASMEELQEAYRILVVFGDKTSKETKEAAWNPFLLYDSIRQQRKIGCFSEREAADSGMNIKNGQELRQLLLEE